MLAEQLLQQGIRPTRYGSGDQKLLCPKCSHTRKDRKDPCLSLTLDGESAVWNCHNCGWTGAIGGDERRTTRPKPSATRPSRAPGDATEAVFKWFAERDISADTVRRNRIGAERRFFPKLQAEADCIAFPYFRDGELVNIKFRPLAAKTFAQVKDAEQILFGLDDIAGSDAAIVVEGEPDKMALDEAGIRNAVSVPDGAPNEVKEEPDPADRKFAFLRNCADRLASLRRVIIAVDEDGPGQALAEELARRLGRERCWRVRWPEGCKDANEVLLKHGRGALRACIEQATPYPIAGLHEAGEFTDEVMTLYREGRRRGASTGFPSLDPFMTIRPGELTVTTGAPNAGKSEFVDALTVNLAVAYGWRFAICSFENPVPEHASKLAEKLVGAPFWDGPTRRMSEPQGSSS